jgi:hypothetical protein
MAFDNFTGYLQASLNYNASKNGPTSGLNFPATPNGNTLNLKTAYTVGSGAGQINEIVAEIVTIAASGSATIDLTVLIDILGFAAALTKLKEFLFCLLNATQDSINGTACTQVTIGNAGTNPNPLNFGGATMTKLLTNGDIDSYATASAAGIAVSGTVKNVLVANNDASHGAAVLACFGGA